MLTFSKIYLWDSSACVRQLMTSALDFRAADKSPYFGSF